MPEKNGDNPEKNQQGDNSGMGIAGALEARHGKLHEDETAQYAETSKTPQPSATATDSYRNPKYREAWRQLYEQMEILPQEAETLSRVADLVRPRPINFGDRIGYFYQTEDNSKQRFLRYLELTGVQDEDYLFVVKNLIPDNLDLQDKKIRLKLGLTDDLVGSGRISRSMVSVIIIPSPHMMASLFDDEMAAFYLRELDEIEKEQGSAVAGFKIPYSYNENSFNPDVYKAFLNFWERRSEQALSNPKKTRQLVENRIDPDQYFDKLQTIGAYLGKGLPSTRNIRQVEFNDLATRFYSFKWDK